MAESGLISKNDTVLDYGCGKGRVSYFLAAQTGAKAIGIEYDERIYREAVQNGENDSCRFELTRAEEYDVTGTVNRCYFFNPFSVEILQSVMAKILASYYAEPREMLLFFYYPSDEYMCYLMSISELDFYDEIDCDDLFEHPDARERIIVFSLPAY